MTHRIPAPEVPITAVILVAGRGTRLRSAHEPPKCLLEVGGTALLERYVSSLDALGIPMVIVAGYRADDVRARLGQIAPRNAATVSINTQFELGSILSLARGLDTVGGDLILLDGDVLFHPDLLVRLATGPAINALLVDVGSPFTGEEYMAGVDGGRVTALRRARVDGHEATGEWVGFARLEASAVRRLRAAIVEDIAAGRTGGGYEDALASILADIDVRAVPTEGLPWIEIDFPDDLTRAAALAQSFDAHASTTAGGSSATRGSAT